MASEPSDDPPSKPRRWRLVKLAALTLLALATVSTVSWLVLRSEPVRQAVLRVASRRIEAATGFVASAGSFDLDPLSRRVVLERVDLRAQAAAPPFLTAERVSATVVGRSLLHGPLELSEVVVERVSVDLAAPLPARRPPRAEAQAEEPGLAVKSLIVHGGIVRGLPTPRGEAVVEDWRLADAELRGSYTSGALDLELVEASVALDLSDRPPIEGRLTARITGELRQGLTFERVELESRGLKLLASGRTGPSGRGPWQLDVALEVLAAELVPDLASAGTLDARGALTLALDPAPVLSGELALSAVAFPAEAIAPWLPRARAFDLPTMLAGSEVQLTARVSGALALGRSPAAAGGLDADVDLEWYDAEGVRLEVALASELEPGKQGAVVELQGSLLPREPGLRRFAGTVQVGAWNDPSTIEIAELRLDLEEPDLRSAARRLGLGQLAELGGVPSGSFEALLLASGPLLDPRATLHGAWIFGGQPVVDFSLTTVDRAPGDRAASFIVWLLPMEPGQRKLEGEIVADDLTQLGEAVVSGGRVRFELPVVGRIVERAVELLADLGFHPASEAAASLLPHEELMRGAIEMSGSFEGPLTVLRADLDADWRAANESTPSIFARTQGAEIRAADWRKSYAGEGELEVHGVELAPWFPSRGEDPTAAPALAGILFGNARFTGPLDDLRAEGEMSASALRIADWLELADVEGRAQLASGRLDARLGARKLPRRESEVEGRIDVVLSSDAEWPPAEAEARVETADPWAGVGRAAARLRLDRDLLHVESLDADFHGEPLSITARLPRTFFVEVPALAALARGAEPVPGSITMSDFRLESLRGLTGGDYPVAGLVNVDLQMAEPAIASIVGTISATDLSIVTDGERTTVSDLRFEMGGGRVSLPRSRLVAAGPMLRGEAPLMVEGWLEPRPAWRPGQPFRELVHDFYFEAEGTVNASLLGPFLRIAGATGPLEVHAYATGDFANPLAELRVSGPGVRVLIPEPYPTKIEAPEIVLVARAGRLDVEHAHARLNDGEIDVEGAWVAGRGLELTAQIDDARYRLAYGLAATIDGRLELTKPPEGVPRLSGDLLVERGVLRRDIQLDREALRLAFGEREAASGTRLLEQLELDLTVRTAEGISVDNNLAQLHADWDLIEVTGTALDPVLEGRIEVQPGARVSLFGQLLRLDEFALVWSGQPLTEPAIIAEYTTAAEDPTLRQGWGSSGVLVRGPGTGGLLDFRSSGAETDVAELASGLAAYYRSELAGAAGGLLGKTQFTFEPLPLFGETDTQARFTISYRISDDVVFLSANDPRQAEGTTYIADIVEIPGYESWRAQLFTLDDGKPGSTLQQTLRFGGTERERNERELRKIKIRGAEGFSRRRLRRATGYSRGDEFPPGATLDVEVDLTDWMRRRGRPAATASVTTVPVGDERVDLDIAVAPGPRVAFEFQGLRPRRQGRREIISEFRPLELTERAALEAVRGETIDRLQALGYPNPVVEVQVLPAEGQGTGVVQVKSEAPARIDPERLAIEGIASYDADYVRSRFPTKQDLVELVAGETGQLDYLDDLLDSLGYPEATLVRPPWYEEEARAVTLEVEPGPRRMLLDVVVEGVPPGAAARLELVTGLEPGQPLRLGAVASARVAIERDLSDRGYRDVSVESAVRPVDLTRPLEVAAHFHVEPGAVHVLDEVDFDGLRASRPRWTDRVAALEPGERLERADVAAARQRLVRTGVFSRVATHTEVRGPTGPPPDHSPTEGPLAAVATGVTFDVEEAPRYGLSYGGRWQSGGGVSVVVDFVDHHSLRRGHTTGVRAIAGTQIQSLRLYHMIPRVIGPRSSLELFTEGRVEELANGQTDELAQEWIQLTTQLGRRTATRFYTTFQNRTVRSSDPEAVLDQRNISPRFGWQWAFNTVDRALSVRERRGLFLGFDVSYADEKLGSDVTVAAVFSQLELFQPLPRRMSWAQSWRAGMVDARDDSIPFGERLFAGGEYSVRGYPDRSLGPLDAQGVPLGGEVQFIVNQELHRPIFREDLLAVLFYDAGNIWSEIDELDGELFQSVGLGLRYASPVGPLRVDFAYPLDAREQDDDVRVHFGFGNIF